MIVVMVMVMIIAPTVFWSSFVCSQWRKSAIIIKRIAISIFPVPNISPVFFEIPSSKNFVDIRFVETSTLSVLAGGNLSLRVKI
jgi:hypothetical protein